MNKYQFKTNINCSGCVAKIAPQLSVAEISKWSVDTDNPSKVLTVETESLQKEDVKQIVEKAGFKAEEIS